MFAVLDQREDVLGLVAVVHDVPDVVDGDAVAELGGELVADEFQRLGKAGGRRPVAAHADFDGILVSGRMTFAKTGIHTGGHARAYTLWRCARLAQGGPPMNMNKPAKLAMATSQGDRVGRRMGGARRSRRRLPAGRALRLGRRHLQPFLHARAGRAAQVPDEAARVALHRSDRVQPGEGVDGRGPRRAVGRQPPRLHAARRRAVGARRRELRRPRAHRDRHGDSPA